MSSVQNDSRQKMWTEWNLWKTFKRPNSNEKEMGKKTVNAVLTEYNFSTAKERFKIRIGLKSYYKNKFMKKNPLNPIKFKALAFIF